jgi:UDP-N-acetylmuramoyl-L-alanyl-D-glutamate--2,6-diaminopimelate ligase
VINIDDAMGESLALELGAGALDVWTVSSHKTARLQAQNVGYDTQGLRFEVVEDAERWLLRSRMIGAFNVSNILGVIGAMRGLGIPLRLAVQACENLAPVPGRMECLGGESEPLVAVDYAHTPDALGQALLALRSLAEQRKGALWCVFGCGGDRDASKRPMMGAIAQQRADRVVVTSDNPRSEKPEAILSQILLGFSQMETVSVQVDRALAIADAISTAARQDVILLAGKGHESTQDIAGVKHPFSDFAHATNALQLRRRRAEVVAA